MIDFVTVNGERRPLASIANLLYATMREENRCFARDVGRPFYGLQEKVRNEWLKATSELLESSITPTAESCHRKWQLIFIRHGWRYGEKYHRRMKKHPALRGWNEADFDENERAIFETMATQLQPIWKANNGAAK